MASELFMGYSMPEKRKIDEIYKKYACLTTMLVFSYGSMVMSLEQKEIGCKLAT